MALTVLSFLASLWLLLATVATAADLPASELQRLTQALQNNTLESVQQLSAQEKLVLRAALSLQSGDAEQTLLLTRQLKSAEKDPLLAVMEAEAHRLLAIRAVAQAGKYGQTLQKQRASLESIDLSNGLAEAETRLLALAEELGGVSGFPVDLLKLGDSIHNVFVVDKSRSRLFLYGRDAQGKFVRQLDEYVVTGTNNGDKKVKGDKRTPNGVYRFVQRLEDPSLHARYGPVSFPIDYPNTLDALHHKTGSGIWMHGYQQDVARRAPQDTLGCIALPNDRLLEIAKKVKLNKSWVLIGENIRFSDEKPRASLRKSAHDALLQWAADWGSRDHKKYLLHYDDRFHSGRHDFQSWDSYKKRVNGRKSFIKVKLSDITLIRDPQQWPEGEVVVAEFNQDYQSSNLSSKSRKRLYLVRAKPEERWKILIEESVKSRAG